MIIKREMIMGTLFFEINFSLDAVVFLSVLINKNLLEKVLPVCFVYNYYINKKTKRKGTKCNQNTDFTTLIQSS